MLTMNCLCSVLVVILTGVSCEELSPVQTEDFSLEGGTVTLSYNYSKLSSGVSCEELSPVQTEDFSLEGGTVTLSYNYSKLSSGVSCEDLSPVQTEDFISQGTTVTLSYTFLKKGTNLYYFFWYRQYPGKPPEFLISHQESGELLSDPVSGLSVKSCCLAENCLIPAVNIRPNTTHKTTQHLFKVNIQRQHLSSVNMDRLTVILFFSALVGVSCEDLSPVQTEDFSSQGTTVTLSYNYAKKATECKGEDRVIQPTSAVTAAQGDTVTLKCSFVTRVSCEDLSPVQTEDFSSQGTTVTLSYNYAKKATGGDYFFWYRQYPGKPPEFLISHQESGKLVSDPVSGLVTVVTAANQTVWEESQEQLIHITHKPTGSGFTLNTA
ncbi:hypothetical protein INR49_027219 [Caranx melampygus]|nr:hypothetical protein INR49_027219 [Caranx melampygus]